MILLNLKHKKAVIKSIPHRRVPEIGESITIAETQFTVSEVNLASKTELPIVTETYDVILERTQQ